MVTDVDIKSSEYRKDLSRFEAGTPPIAQVAGLSAAIDYISALDLGQCQKHVNKLALDLRKGLKNLGVECIGSPSKSSGIVSAVFGEIHPHDVATYLNSKNIAVRAGHHCTQLIMKKYGIHSSVRFSFSIYNTRDEVDKILDAVVSMQKYFK